MAIVNDAEEFHLVASGRVIIAGAGFSRRAGDGSIGVASRIGDSLGGGMLSVEESYEAIPDVATASHWSVLDDLDALEAGKSYVAKGAGATVAVNLTGATSPSVHIIRR